MRTKDFVRVIWMALGLTILISILFYRSVWGVLLFPLAVYFLYQRETVREKEKRRKELEEQFMNGIRVLNTSLQAGLSMENAWKEVQHETELLYGKEAVFFQEVQEINGSVEMNIPLEKRMLEFAYRSEVEDIISFAEIFAYGKKSGGNWKRIIDTTVLHLNEKYEAREEIEVMIAGKKMEQQIMNMIPLGMLAFLQLSAWDYMRVLYHNPLGIVCMSVCLTGYVIAIFLSQKILQIQV